MKTLHNTYCKPNIEEWEKITALLKSIEKYYWRKYDNDGNCFLHDDTVYLSNGTIGDWNTRTEIPVQHFIDLIEDKIVAWRLVEDGFGRMSPDADRYEYEMIKYGRLARPWQNYSAALRSLMVKCDGEVWLSIFVFGNEVRHPCNVKTYTQLINLIELIG